MTSVLKLLCTMFTVLRYYYSYYYRRRECNNQSKCSSTSYETMELLRKIPPVPMQGHLASLQITLCH